jgi:hypothetical protein
VNLEVPIPAGAEERARHVVMAAFASHRPAPRKRTYWRPAIAIAVVAAVAGVLASPPGRSVVNSLREAVGVEHAKKELFSLPAPGRLLVQSVRGAWVVQQNGSKRLLGQYREASWSPFGRFVVAARANELVALEPNGTVHWTLARPGVRSPRWGGLRTDTRIAYDSRAGLRVVAGDSSGDRLLLRAVHGPFAWRPGRLAQLASVNASEVRLQDTDSGRVFWRAKRGSNEPVRRIVWSADGTRLLIVAAHDLLVLDDRGQVVAHVPGSFLDATFVGATPGLAVLTTDGDVRVESTLLFHAAGLRELVSAPDGRWLLATWPGANQWVFVRTAAPHTIRAYAGIARQFGGESFRMVSGWIPQ